MKRKSIVMCSYRDLYSSNVRFFNKYQKQKVIHFFFKIKRFFKSVITSRADCTSNLWLWKLRGIRPTQVSNSHVEGKIFFFFEEFQISTNILVFLQKMGLLKRKIIITIEIFFINLTFLRKQDDVCYFVSIKIENSKNF